MSSTIHTSRATARALLVALAAVLAVAGTLVIDTQSAHAVRAFTVDGLSSNPAFVADGDIVHISGSGFTPGKLVVIAQCNATAGGVNGTHCSRDFGVPPSIPPSFTRVHADVNGNVLALITLHETFSNWDFQANAALGTTTICAHAPGWNGVCQIQLAEYATYPPMGPPTATVTVNLLY